MTRRWILAALAATAVAAGPAEAAAQDARWFRSFDLRGGVFAPRATGGIYDFVTDRLTLSGSDFLSRSAGVEAEVWTWGRGALVAGVSTSRSSQASQYRNRMGDDGLPLEQTTTLEIQPALQIGARAYLRPPLDAADLLAGRFNLYGEADAGWMRYRFEQRGRFHDEVLDVVFEGDLQSSGGAAFAQLGAGAAARVLENRAELVVEGGYRWGNAPLARDFRGFEPIDLSGFELSVGVRLLR